MDANKVRGGGVSGGIVQLSSAGKEKREDRSSRWGWDLEEGTDYVYFTSDQNQCNLLSFYMCLVILKANLAFHDPLVKLTHMIVTDENVMMNSFGGYAKLSS